MKKSLLSLLFALLFAAPAISQEVYFTKDGYVKFFSSAPLEDIAADNNKVTSFLKTNGDIVFAVPIRSFSFEKSLMQEHFNEKYMETEKYPKATFKGRIVNIEDVDFSKDGVYDVVVEGELTIHGVTKAKKEKGTIEVKGDQVIARSKFDVSVKDYDIEIPKLVINNIAEVVEVTVDLVYSPYKRKESIN